MQRPPYTAFNACTGAADGWSQGLARVGIRTVAGCEIVPWRRAAVQTNFPGVRLYEDLSTITADQVRRDLGYFPEFLFGSPPCTEFSEVNARGGGLDADGLFFDAARLVDEGRPRGFGFENSHRVLLRGYDRIAAKLEGYGYAIWPLVLEARNAGAKHERPRVFILGSDLSGPQGRPARQPRLDQGVGARVRGLRGVFGRALPHLGPTGQAGLGRHLRAYDGVPAWVSDRCREAYGDAVLPALTEAVGRGVLQLDAALWEWGAAA